MGARAFVSRSSLLWLSGTIMLCVSLALMYLDAWLRTDVSPSGIVSFEFAGSAERAHAMIASWGPDGHRAAALILGIDYLYLVAYSVFLMLAGLALSERLHPGWPRYAGLLRGFALAMPLAGAFDAIENFGSIRLLFGSTLDFWAQLAYLAAIPKFAIALGTLLLLAVGGGLASRSRTKQSAAGE
jgi:hypothetical protein